MPSKVAIFFDISLDAKAQFKCRAIVVSNKLDCRTSVDSNVEFNLVVPDISIDWNVEPG